MKKNTLIMILVGLVMLCAGITIGVNISVKNSKVNSDENICFLDLKEKKSNLDLKLLYLNSIYIKMRLNRLRSAFDFIYNNKLKYKEILRKSSNYNKINKNNLFLKRYLTATIYRKIVLLNL